MGLSQYRNAVATGFVFTSLEQTPTTTRRYRVTVLTETHYVVYRPHQLLGNANNAGLLSELKLVGEKGDHCRNG